MTVERSAPRRILPSLIELPQPEPEAVEAVAPEPRLPRVRRVSRAAPSEPHAAAAEIVVPPVAAPLVRPPTVQGQAADRAAEAPAPTRRPAKRQKAAPALPLGERWKRRLPRVCW